MSSSVEHEVFVAVGVKEFYVWIWSETLKTTRLTKMATHAANESTNHGVFVHVEGGPTAVLVDVAPLQVFWRWEKYS